MPLNLPSTVSPQCSCHQQHIFGNTTSTFQASRVQTSLLCPHGTSQSPLTLLLNLKFCRQCAFSKYAPRNSLYHQWKLGAKYTIWKKKLLPLGQFGLAWLLRFVSFIHCSLKVQLFPSCILLSPWRCPNDVLEFLLDLCCLFLVTSRNTWTQINSI